ncbi:MAG TPA: hypothetical protein DCE41_19475 [Cytophagales bacterium]|nr:hypothetical protein [Cytophagales bacterium]
MQTWISLTLNDVRNVVRDRLLLMIFFVPAILLGFVRGIMPIVLEHYPNVAEYQHIILMLATAQIPTTFGLVAAFVMLDEKDERVFEVLRSLPVSSNRFIGFRLGWVFGFTALGAAIFLSFSGLMELSLASILQASLLYGILSVVLTLFIVTYTANKVEGLAVFKGVNIAMYLPVLPWVWDNTWMQALAVMPSYWPFRIIGESLPTGDSPFIWFGIGVAVLVLIVALLLTQFRKRVFG